MYSTNTIRENSFSYKELIKNKNYVLFLLGRLISRFGDSIDSIAYGWMVFEITGSASLMALLFGVNSLPNIIFQPFAGVIVNYKRKKTTLLICNLGRAIVVTITTLMFFTGTLKAYHLFIFTFINTTFEAFQSPASMSALSLILEKDCYSYAISLDSTLSNIVQLVGLASAAGIIALVGISGGLFINALSFYTCGILMFLVKYKNDILSKSKINIKGFCKDLKDGLIYIKKKNLIFQLCIFLALFNILVIPIDTLSIAFVNEDLKLGTEAVAVLNFAMTLGMLIGSLFFPKIREKFNGKKLFIIAGIIFGSTYFALSFLPLIKVIILSYIMLFLISFTLGISFSMIDMLLSVVFMENIESEYVSRITGVSNSLLLAAAPIGSVIMSVVCKFLNTSKIYCILGLIIIILFIIQKYNKSINGI